MQAKKKKVEPEVKKSRKPRCAITLEEKLNIIRMHENGKVMSRIAREINRPISTICTIVKDKARIIESAKDAVTLSGTIITKRRQGPISDMEKVLAQWIQEMTEKETPLTLAVIQEKARALYKEILDKAGVTDMDNTFKASAGWFERFKKRVNLNGYKMNGGDGGGHGSNGVSKNKDIALAKLEAMDPDAERFENISRRIYSNLSSYKSIYYESKRSSSSTGTTSTQGTCMRCHSDLAEDNPDDYDYNQASAEESGEVDGEHMSCSHASPSGESESDNLGIASHFLINN